MVALPFRYKYVYWPAGQFGIVQVVSSFSISVVKPFEQIAQDDVLNGFKLGRAMNEPTGQHPKRAVLDPSVVLQELAKAFH